MKLTIAERLANLYDEIMPPIIRRRITPWIERPYAQVSRSIQIIGDLRQRIQYVRDGESGILFCERHRLSRLFYDRIFQHPSELGLRASSPLWMLPTNASRNNCSIIVEADEVYKPFFDRHGFLSVPDWIQFILNTSIPISGILNKAGSDRRRDIILFSKRGLSFERTRDPSAFQHFYEFMHLPYIRQRFGDLAYTAPIHYLQDLVNAGQLIIVRQDGIPISGGVVAEIRGSPMLVCVGVLHTNHQYVKNGALTAIYYEAIRWALDEGYPLLDLGYSRPLLSDGNVIYKKRWGATVQKGGSRQRRMLYISLRSPGSMLRRFLLDNPLVILRHGKLYGALFVESRRTCSFAYIDELQARHHIPGLAGFETIFLDELR